ncbi:MAG: AAA family ATPase, partial [Deltaproteobacteria bacterium]|nr:AAA family ATPase [Deltaproteobacteria bacterium]
MTLKRLPLGDRSFPQIIDENFLYADKTRYIYETLNGDSNCYFLSRPRRFGKTLLLSVFKELFSGRRERFKGLWIDQSDYDFPEVPVIHLS